ncbi:MAG: SGNH/GDSL hydrolase family protein, partial [Phycisphaerae bacterium]|nr:SGNH/GDSL hydrolase family protein [Phycisphaerae bacterium]
MPETTKPRVLLLGDSIRMSYAPVVAEALEGVADVVSPEDNGAHTLYTLYRLEAWLAQAGGTPDVIHWN